MRIIARFSITWVMLYISCSASAGIFGPDWEGGYSVDDRGVGNCSIIWDGRGWSNELKTGDIGNYVGIRMTYKGIQLISYYPKALVGMEDVKGTLVTSWKELSDTQLDAFIDFEESTRGLSDYTYLLCRSS